MKFKYIYLCALLALVSCKKNYINEAENTQESVKNVALTPVSTLQHTEPVIATGRVASSQEVALSFKTGGILRSLTADEGDFVTKGAELARLDLQEINAQVAAAKFNYEKTSRDAERANLLYQDTVGTLENLQNARTAKDLAKSQYDIAQFNRQYSIIRMPVKGVVLERLVEEGELVNPGQPIYKIGNTGSKGAKILKLGMSDKQVTQLQLRDKGRVVFDALSKSEFPIQVTEIAQSANPNTGLFNVEVAILDSEAKIRNGFIGNVSIYPSQKSSGLKIPINALVEGSGKQAVLFYSEDTKTAKRKEIPLLEIRKDYILIPARSLPENAAVITTGASYLRDGDTIAIAKK